MDFDLELINQSKPDKAVLRFYGWDPYCISVGANQSIDDLDIELASQNKIDIVKRPTGGRAILHAEELTYSVVFPNALNTNVKQAYEQVSLAIVDGLKNYHPALNDVMLETQQPNFSKSLKEIDGSICFSSTAKSEIKYKGKKLVGSAQRKFGSTILQHGSILIGTYHENLVNYLNVNSIEREKLRKNISEKTTNLSGIINTNIDIIKLQENIILGFQKLFSTNFVITELTPSLGY